MRRSSTVAVVASACLIAAPAASAGSLAFVRTYSLQGTFVDDAGKVATDLSGLACTARPARHCLAGNDENRTAQFATLEDGRILPRADLTPWEHYAQARALAKQQQCWWHSCTLVAVPEPRPEHVVLLETWPPARSEEHKEEIELVASFQECRRFSPSSWCKSRGTDEGGAVRKMRATPWQRIRWNACDRRMFYSCAP